MHWICGKALVCAAMLVLTCVMALGQTADATEAEPARAAWADKQPSAWPQILLGHDMTFRNGGKIEGASAFLLRLDAVNVVGVSAKHILDEGQDLSTLEKQVTNWRLVPRSSVSFGGRASFVQLRRLVVRLPEADRTDWMAALAVTSAKWAAEPLTPRKRPVEPGEKVYLIAVPYSEGRPQNVYAAKVVDDRDAKGDFWFDFSPTVQTRGFSGAPIVDADGLCVGMYVAHATNPPGPNKVRGVGKPIGGLLELIDESRLVKQK